MTREEVQSLLQRHQQALNRHDVDALTSLYVDDAVIESPMFDTVHGRDAIRRSFERLFAIFPDYTIELRDALFIAEGNRAAEFSRVTGTQRLDLFGLSPTGQPVEYHAARLFTFTRGRIAYEQRIYDFRGVLERLEKARLDQELTVASAVQHTLCRTHHAGAFFEIVGSSLPCRAIGGDFLEYIDLPSGAVGIAVGDVSGKGPAAALVAAMLQGMFSIVAMESEEPRAALTRVNRALCRRGIEPRFATLAYAVLSPDGVLTYSNAGHNPSLLLTRAGVTRLTVGGPMLGVFDDAVFPQATVTLQPGDGLVAFSDGVTDAIAPDGDDFGTDRLIASAAEARSSPPSQVLAQLFSTVREFCGAVPPADDVTMAVLRFAGSGRERPGP
ncbi:MAG: SpoIIE family protein phosphatase [Acidobacteriota bacterium]